MNEVIQKVLAQEQQQTSLRDLSKDNHDKIESLNATITALRERVEELKYSGSGFMTVSACLIKLGVMKWVGFDSHYVQQRVREKDRRR